MNIARFGLLPVFLALIAPTVADPQKITCDRQLAMRIDSAKVSVEPGGFSIDAFGVSESAGWKNPTLIVAGQADGGVVNVDFVACRPEVSAQVLTPIQANSTLDLDLATTRQVVIRAKTNSMTVDISR